jgi:PucR C-terminal helix-turn-helix domain
VVEAIRQVLPELADEIVSTIEREIAEYSDPLRGDFGRGIRRGVEQALRRFVGDGGEQARAVYRDLGRGEHRAGRSLDALQSAYRVGARVAWRRLSRVVATAGASVEVQHQLAEAMFAYIDQLASESVDGYAQAQSAQAGDLEHRRSALLTTLLCVPASDPNDLRAAATAARWPLPELLACLVVSRNARQIARRISSDALPGSNDGVACVIVPNPAGLLAGVETIAARQHAAIGVGPAVATADAHRSFVWAQLASELAGDAGAVSADQRLADLTLQAQPEILDALRARTLAPLAEETPHSRHKLEATLRSWLRRHGSQAAVAADLQIHPQTVRYRIRRLRDLFGPALEDPDRRFELELALRQLQ